MSTSNENEGKHELKRGTDERTKKKRIIESMPVHLNAPRKICLNYKTNRIKQSKMMMKTVKWKYGAKKNTGFAVIKEKGLCEPDRLFQRDYIYQKCGERKTCRTCSNVIRGICSKNVGYRYLCWDFEGLVVFLTSLICFLYFHGMKFRLMRPNKMNEWMKKRPWNWTFSLWSKNYWFWPMNDDLFFFFNFLYILRLLLIVLLHVLLVSLFLISPIK